MDRTPEEMRAAHRELHEICRELIATLWETQGPEFRQLMIDRGFQPQPQPDGE